MAKAKPIVRLLLDAGPLIGLEQDPRSVLVSSSRRMLRRHQRRVLVPSVVLAQVWRNDPAQHALHKLCQQCEHLPFTVDSAKSVGNLLKASGTTDIVDAAVVVAAIEHGAAVMTSDPDDLERLIEAAGVDVPLVTV